MSGSRDNRESIGDKLLNEVRSAFAMVKKDFRQFPVEFAIDTDLTIFSTDFYCDVDAVNFASPAPETADGLSASDLTNVAVIEDPLLKEKAVIADDGIDPEWETEVHEVPVFDDPELFLHQVTFDSMKVRDTHALPVGDMTTGPRKWALGKALSTRTKPILLSKIKTSQQARQIPPLRRRSKPFPKPMFCMPFVKTAIPTHRFSTDARKQFRMALAEKAQTEPSNILVNRIYDRINVSMFKSISQDERGTLVCHPKPECVGKQRNLGRVQETSFLVMGQRLDTKENISALVPVSDVEGDEA